MGNPETSKEIEQKPSAENKAEKDEVLNLNRVKKELIESGRLQEKFLFAIDKIKNHPQWQKKVVNGFWKKLTAKDRELLYRGGEPGLFKTLKKGSPILALIPIPEMKYDDNRLKFLGDRLSEGARSMVQMDMLPAPEGIEMETISKDILSDKKNLKRVLTAIQFLVSIFAPEAAKEVQEAKVIANQFIDIKTDVAIKQQEKKAA
jgi:hypothetical protein